MVVAAQPLDHVHAHFAETNESDFHPARSLLADDDSIRNYGRAAELRTRARLGN
jgi:hypothetical protein